MTDCEKLIEKLDAALSNNSVDGFSETFGDDVGLLNDVFSTFDTTLEDGQPDYKKGLKILATKYFPEEFCHYEYVACGADDKATKTRMVKLKTRLYYKQLKFNLLREESEGYAKAIAELFSGDKYNDPQRTLSRLQKLIGQFNLDPNRVIDILLDCFEANSERANFYTGILSALKVSRQDLADILKRKFIFQEKLDGSAYSLCNLAAIICEQGLVDLLPFFSFLDPDQKTLTETNKAHIALTKARAKKAEIIITSNADVKMVETEEETKNVAALPFYVALSSQLSEDIELLGDFYDDNINLSKNLKLGLICALLERGAWDIASKLIEKFPQFSVVSISQRIQLAITRLIDHSISYLYNFEFNDETFRLSTAPSGNTNSNFRFAPVKTWIEFVDFTIPMINQLGPYIAVDPISAFKLLRIVTLFFRNMKLNSELKKLEIPMIDIVDNSILPALSLLESSYTYSDELWELLSYFTYQQRFRLYSHWKSIHTPRFLEVQRGKVLGRTKYCIKRLSKDTVKLIGRLLGKLCHIHPFAVFDYLLDQVQVFQNFITPVVDSLRFLSPLELDVLTFCVIENLSSPDKGQLKTDDGTLSTWIIALATFIGALYKKYPSDLTSMLQFIVNELKNGKSLDLLILREIVSNMSGIDANASLTENGNDALTGGEVLKQEIFHTLAVRSSKRLSARLKEALLKDDLLPSLFILMAQQKSCVVFVDSEILPLKLTGQLLDQCRDTFVQFNSFLQFAFKPDECAAILPKADELIRDYYLPIECSMYFWRENYMREIQARWKEGVKKLKGEDQTIDETQSLLLFTQSFQNVVNSLETSLIPLNEDSFWTDVSKRLYVIFWLLDLGDLQCPTALYEKLIGKVSSERSESHETSSKKRQKEDKAQVLERKLKDELAGRQQHIQLIRGYLKQQISTLFPLQTQTNPVHRFIQTCLMPRAMFSETDAAFCARFIELLHLQKTHNMQTLILLDKLFCDSALVINGLTEKESHSIGTFYEMLLTLSLKWHSNISIYNEECLSHPMRLMKSEKGEIKDTQYGYEEFRALVYKWHFRLCKSLMHMINAGSYVSKRNALIVLTKILPAFPAVTPLFNLLVGTAEKLRDKEKGVRNDLSLLAASYHTQLKKRHASMIPVADFYTKENKSDLSSSTAQSSQSTAAQSTTSDRSVRKRITVDTETPSSSPSKKQARGKR